jgi:cytochrome c peroxidase
MPRRLSARSAPTGFGCTAVGFAAIGLTTITLTAATAVVAQVSNPSTRGQEPIAPIVSAPAQDTRRVALGERLFRDPRLSHNNTRSCSSCHDVETNGASATARDFAFDGQPLALNTLTVFNATLSFRLNWEGKFRTPEEQADRIIRNPALMASSPEGAVDKLRADPETAKQFRDIYGRPPDVGALLDALATYERSLVTPGGRFDRWLLGDSSAITAQELSGYQLFKSLGCVTCHQGVNVGGNLFQRRGIFQPLGAPEPAIVRVPSLRNVAMTPPYFHDGSAASLQEAVKAMGKAQLDRLLTDQQVSAIVTFLHTLTGTYRGQAIRPAGPPATMARP